MPFKQSADITVTVHFGKHFFSSWPGPSFEGRRSSDWAKSPVIHFCEKVLCRIILFSLVCFSKALAKCIEFYCLELLEYFVLIYSVTFVLKVIALKTRELFV